jgi:hypothetical protein
MASNRVRDVTPEIQRLAALARSLASTERTGIGDCAKCPDRDVRVVRGI